jgi:hypothetical protein
VVLYAINYGVFMEYKVDKATGREYFVVGQNEKIDFSDQDVNRDNLLIGSFNNTARVLMNNGTLVVYENKDPVELYASLTNNQTDASELNYNFMRFYIWGDHAVFEINCRACDNGKPMHKFVDLISKVSVEIDPTESVFPDYFSSRTPRCDELNYFERALLKPEITTNMNPKDFNNTIKILLTDTQANRVSNVINQILELEKQDNYTYVAWSHDCVSLLTDVYRMSGFDRHFSEYLTDEELFESPKFDESTSGKAYLHRSHDFSYQADPSRKAVTEFVKSQEGENFANLWFYGIFRKVVDKSKLLNNPELLKRYNDAQETKNKILPALIDDFLKMKNITLTAEQLTILLNDMLPVTYYDLYYYKSAEQIYNMLQEYKNSAVASKLFAPEDMYYGLKLLGDRCGNEVTQDQALESFYECQKLQYEKSQDQFNNLMMKQCNKDEFSRDRSITINCNAEQPLRESDIDLCLALKFECGRYDVTTYSC